MGVPDCFKRQRPVLPSLICKKLRLTGNRIYLTIRSPNFVDYAGLKIAPQLGAARGSPKPSIEEQNNKCVLRHDGVGPRQPSTRGRVEVRLRSSLL